jgi:hypothetical protein
MYALVPRGSVSKKLVRKEDKLWRFLRAMSKLGDKVQQRAKLEQFGLIKGGKNNYNKYMMGIMTVNRECLAMEEEDCKNKYVHETIVSYT